MQLGYNDFPAELRATVPGFEPIYQKHLADYDELLPHVLLGELVHFLTSESGTHGAQSVALQQAMPLLERAMASSDARLQELIAVSFLENLDPAEPGFSAIRQLFGPQLEQQYQQYEQAR